MSAQRRREHCDTAEALLSRLEGVRHAGVGRWLACCPAHDDRIPSLSIRELDNGKVLVYCHAGCTFDDIVLAAGIKKVDLFPSHSCGPGLVGEQRVRARRDNDGVSVAAQARAAEIWGRSDASICHPYLILKRVKPHGTRVYKSLLVVPVRNVDGALHGLQFIAADGTKKFVRGSNVKSNYFPIGHPTGVLCIAEGFATAAAVHEATGYAAVCAFSAQNLVPVAKALRAKFPSNRIVVCADDDNVGITKAVAAARAVRGRVAYPRLPGSAP